ncbi:MAG: RES family NAD+ phosphorylase [Sciscionella sp.]
MRAGAPLLWRIHRTQGGHVSDWNQLRTFGPLPSMRYDPHPEPLEQYDEGVLYAAADHPGVPALVTAVAEVFQATRAIDVDSFAPQLTAWTPTRDLRLLDLTGDWALGNQAAHSLAHAPRSTCRAWARAIRATWPDLDGLWAPSTMSAGTVVVLWNPAHDSFPATPAFSRPLAHPLVRRVLAQIAADIGYGII